MFARCFSRVGDPTRPVGSGQEVSKLHGSGRVGSGQEVLTISRVGPDQFDRTRPDPNREVWRDPRIALGIQKSSVRDCVSLRWK